MNGMNVLKVFVLCEGDNGMASRCLPMLVAEKSIEVTGVLLVAPTSRKRSRLLKKIAKIGLLGALNGIRMRKWYADDEPSLHDLCQQFGVPLITGLRQNTLELQMRIRRLDADLGLSLGNGFISQKTFIIPRLGMINVHSEILPRYQNAQSIIWPIYCRDPYTGFTIHEIDRKIDGGRILYQKRIPIQFERSLEMTVRKNRSIVEEMIPNALVDVCANFAAYRECAQEQHAGTSFTTPSVFQFMRMCRNNRWFYSRGGQDHAIC